MPTIETYPYWKVVDNSLHLWGCEEEGCKEVAKVGFHKGFRIDIYCEEHAKVRGWKDMIGVLSGR